MILVVVGDIRRLTPTEGMMLTNGEVYSKEIYLGVNDSKDNWYEISDEEYIKIVEEEEALMAAKMAEEGLI